MVCCHVPLFVEPYSLMIVHIFLHFTKYADQFYRYYYSSLSFLSLSLSVYLSIKELWSSIVLHIFDIVDIQFFRPSRYCDKPRPGRVLSIELELSGSTKKKKKNRKKIIHKVKRVLKKKREKKVITLRNLLVELLLLVVVSSTTSSSQPPHYPRTRTQNPRGRPPRPSIASPYASKPLCLEPPMQTRPPRVASGHY